MGTRTRKIRCRGQIVDVRVLCAVLLLLAVQAAAEHICSGHLLLTVTPVYQRRTVRLPEVRVVLLRRAGGSSSGSSAVRSGIVV